MKNIVFVVILAIFSFHVYAQEQPAQIKKSTEKVIINGKVYYLHVVKEGQTAFSISRAYNVTLQDIAAENHGILLEQIKPGMTLKIPVVSKAESLSAGYFGYEENDFIYHTVKQGENAYFLSKKYNVPLDIIYKFNPGTSGGIQVDQVIKIPKRRILKDILEKDRDYEKYVYYEAKKKDTLYNLSKRYGVTVADIISNNPELRWGLKAGEIIKIPLKSQSLSDTLQIAQDTLSADTLFQQIGFAACDSIRLSMKTSNIKVALFLPFFSEFTLELKKAAEDTAGLDAEAKEALMNRNVTNIKGAYYFEFYEGVLMALDSLRHTGLNVNLFVYDTEKDTSKVKSILLNLESEVPDLIIGPVFPETFRQVASFAKAHQINIVSPLYSRIAQLNNFTNAFQVVPSKEAEFDAIARLTSERIDNNIILIHDADTTEREEIEQLKNTLFRYFEQDSVLDQIVLKDVNYNDSLLINMKHALSSDRKNFVIVISNNEAYVSIVLSNLDANLRNCDIEVLGMPSWLGFRNIDLEYFHNLQVILFTPFFIDYNDRDTKHFLKKCIDILGYEPQELKSKGYNLTFLGYDIAFYFIKAYLTYGRSFQKCINYMNLKSLLCNYRFIQHSPVDGFENQSIIYIRYNKDFTVNKLLPGDLFKEKKSYSQNIPNTLQ